MGRVYEIDGKYYPSVTTVLSIIKQEEIEKARRWVDDLDRYRDEAAEYGTAFHKILEWNDAARIPSEIPDYYTMDETMYTSVTNYQQWAQTYVDTWLYIEKTVKSSLGYAGTLDRLAILKGDMKPTLIDIKTSSVIHKTYYLQLAAYEQALIEEDEDLEVGRHIIVHIPRRTGKLKIHEVERTPRNFQLFMSALNLFKEFGGNEHEIIRA